MSKKEMIETKAWEIMEERARELGLIPVDAEYVKEGGDYRLVATIDKEGGVGINDCEALSRAIDPLLDEADFIDDPYTLIVTSPGLGRVIRRPRDFVFAEGRQVDVRTYRAIDGTKEWQGILMSHDKETVTLQTAAGEKVFNRKDVSKINLTLDL